MLKFCTALFSSHYLWNRIGKKLYVVHVMKHVCTFSSLFQALNLILLTSTELSDLRDLLKQSMFNDAGKKLFLSLYASWCHSPGAIISLCLLAQVSLQLNAFYFIVKKFSATTSLVLHHFLVIKLRMCYLLLRLFCRLISTLVPLSNHWLRKILMLSFWSSWTN